MYRYSSSSNCDSEAENEHIIIFLDIDCFEVQVWLKESRPDLIGEDVPIVVVNFDERILSVNYTAKSLGVKRDGWDSVNDARSICDREGEELIEIEAGERYGKVDTFIPQVEGDKVLKAIQTYQANLGRKSSSIIIERSSKDEYYIDVTALIQDPNLFSTLQTPSRSKLLKLTKYTKRNPNQEYYGQPITILETDEYEPVYGQNLFNRIKYEDEYRSESQNQEELSLIHGAIIAQNLMKIIKEETGYQASAGVAHSKLVAKLACSRNKPEGITIIANASHQRIQEEMDIQELPGFQGRTGARIKQYYQNTFQRNKATIYEIVRATIDRRGGVDFESVFKKLKIPNSKIRAQEFYELCYFWDETPVNPVVHPKTYRTSMSFDGDDTWRQFKDKIFYLYRDMRERIIYHENEGRIAQNLVVKAKIFDDSNPNVSWNLIKTIHLPEQTPLHKIVYSDIRDYCNESEGNYLNIGSICLIAKNIYIE